MMVLNENRFGDALHINVWDVVDGVMAPSQGMTLIVATNAAKVTEIEPTMIDDTIARVTLILKHLRRVKKAQQEIN